MFNSWADDVSRGAFAEASIPEEPGAGKPRAGILRQAQYRSVRGLSGNWQSYRDGNPVNGHAYQKKRGNDDGEYL
jgi:hypothetical protein